MSFQSASQRSARQNMIDDRDGGCHRAAASNFVYFKVLWEETYYKMLCVLRIAWQKKGTVYPVSIIAEGYSLFETHLLGLLIRFQLKQASSIIKPLTPFIFSIS